MPTRRGRRRPAATPDAGGEFPWRPARVRVGTVGKPHGLDGTFRVADPCGWWPFATRSAVLVGGRDATVVRRAGGDDAPLVALDVAPDRDAAEALRGTALEVPRAALPRPEPDAWYRFDLVGCTAVCGGREVGPVVAVEDGVAHDVLVVGTEPEIRIPFVAAVVPEVDVPARRVVVADGFLP